jgi:hypothetical protein
MNAGQANQVFLCPSTEAMIMKGGAPDSACSFAASKNRLHAAITNVWKLILDGSGQLGKKSVSVMDIPSVSSVLLDRLTSDQV